MRLILLFILFFIFPNYLVLAQATKYSEPVMGETMFIAGVIGGNIHAWSVTEQSGGVVKRPNTLLTLHMFSSVMALVNERRVSMGRWKIRTIDFQNENSYYYIDIWLINQYSVTKRQIYKVDVNGQLTDVTNTPGVLNKPHYYSYSSYVAVNNSNLFQLKYSGIISGSLIDSAILPAGEVIDTSHFYKIIALQKLGIVNRQLLKEGFLTSSYLDFSNPLLSAADNTIFVSAFAKPKIEINTGTSAYNGSYLFLDQLDTNLVEKPQSKILFKSKKWPSGIQFIPNAVVSLNNRTIILSTGLKSNINFTNGLNGSSDQQFGYSQMYTTLSPNSIIITQLDANHSILTDTIIKLRLGQERLNLENRLIRAERDKLLIFYSHSYTATASGITLFTVDKHGGVEERELIVNKKYSYMLRGSESLGHGVMLVPYIYKRKTGLVKLTYPTFD